MTKTQRMQTLLITIRRVSLIAKKLSVEQAFGDVEERMFVLAIEELRELTATLTEAIDYQRRRQH